jgi:hypothetical protein
MMTWLIKKPELVHIMLDKVSEFVIKVAAHCVKVPGREARGVPRRSHRIQHAYLAQAVRDSSFVPPEDQHRDEMGVGRSSSTSAEQNKNCSGGKAVTRQSSVSPGGPSSGDGVVPDRSSPGTSSTIRRAPEEVLAQAKECIETAVQKVDIALAGCDLPHAPPVNVFQLVKAAREFGRY